MTDPAQGWRTLPRTVWALSATSFLRDVASEMIGNLLPIFLFSTLGVRTSVIGLIEGLTQAMSSLTRLYSGWLSDKIGDRKGLTVAGYGIAAVATAMLFWATTWPMIMLIRLLDRFGKGIRTAPRDALLAESTPVHLRGLAFGLHRAADTAGAFVGLLQAMLIIWIVQGSAASLPFATWQTIVIWAIIPSILSVLVVAFGVRGLKKTTPAPKRQPGDPRINRRFYQLLAIMVLFTLGNSSDAFLILRVEASGASLLEILGILALFNACYSLLSGPAGQWSDRVGRRRVIGLGWLLYVLVYLGFGLAKGGWHWYGLYVLYGIYYALTDGVTKALVADVVPADRRGTAFGLYNAAIGLSALPSSLIAGILWQGVGSWPGFGPAAPFLFGAACAGLALVLLMSWFQTGGHEPSPATSS